MIITLILIAPILANLFTGHHEEQWISNNKDSQLLFYCRYVDDTLFHNEQDAMKFLNYLNSRHPNIKFTYETQLNGKLPFFDVLVNNLGASCITSICHKSTYTGLLTDFLSFTCFKYKVGLIYTLVDRIFKINTTTIGREKDLQQLSITLQRNSFLSPLIDKIITGYKKNFHFDRLKITILLLGKTVQVFGTSNCHLWVIFLPSYAKN